MLEHRIVEMMAEERIQRSREEAERAHLLRGALSPSTSLYQRFAVSLAGLLIAAGTFIQKRYEPISYPEQEADCSPC